MRNLHSSRGIRDVHTKALNCTWSQTSQCRTEVETRQPTSLSIGCALRLILMTVKTSHTTFNQAAECQKISLAHCNAVLQARGSMPLRFCSWRFQKGDVGHLQRQVQSFLLGPCQHSWIRKAVQNQLCGFAGAPTKSMPNCHQHIVEQPWRSSCST